VAGNLDVLPYLCHRRFALGFKVGLGISREPPGHFLGESAEQVVARHKIRLAVHFHQHPRPPAGGDVLGNDALPGFPRGYFTGGDSARLAQNIHRRVQVAFGFPQRFLAFHHPRAGHPAQFGNQCRINFSHRNSP
jgi:hypothetical protein